MKYLWVTRWALDGGLKGGAIDYSRELVDKLSDIASVTLLAFAHPRQSEHEKSGLRVVTVPQARASRIRGVFSPLPNVAFQFASAPSAADLRRAILREAADADCVFVDFIAMFWIEDLFGEIACPVVLINHNFETDVRFQLASATSNPARRLLLSWDAVKAKRLERSANADADGFVTLTEADRTRFKAYSSKPSLAVSPGYSGSVVGSRTLTPTPDLPVVCVFGGRTATHKRMVLEETLRALSEADAAAHCRIDIVGADTPTALIDKYPRFNFLGFVDDIDAYFAKVALGIIPDMIGGGFKLRVLDHVFHRVPIAAVSVAVAGMGLRPQVDFACFDTVAELARSIGPLVRDVDLLDRLQNSAFDQYDGKFDWTERARSLDAFARSLSRAAAPKA